MNSRDNISIYKIWSNPQSPWSTWCKPVVFAQMPFFARQPLNFAGINANLPDKANFADNTAVIFDLPGVASLKEAMTLVEEGYMPVPLFNSVSAGENQRAVIDVTMIQKAIFEATDIIAAVSINSLNKPAFILDSDRMKNYSNQETIYDNRWCVFPQDFPTGALLKKHHIKQVIIKTEVIKDDIMHVLRKFQDDGLIIYHLHPTGKCELIKIGKPLRYKSLSRRFFNLLSLSRNTAGGFGTKKMLYVHSTMHG